jgi:hypothetical protein
MIEIAKIQEPRFQDTRFLSINDNRYNSELLILDSKESLREALNGLVGFNECYVSFGVLTPRILVEKRFGYNYDKWSKYAFYSFGLLLPKSRQDWLNDDKWHKFFVPLFSEEEDRGTLAHVSLVESIDYLDPDFFKILQKSKEVYDTIGMSIAFGPAPFLESAYAEIIRAKEEQKSIAASS